MDTAFHAQQVINGMDKDALALLDQHNKTANVWKSAALDN